MRIAVAGGAGVVGKHVVQAASHAGHDVVSISRRTGVDVQTGVGLSEVLQGVEVIIDTTNVGTTNRAKATTFFTEVAGQLRTAGAAQGVSHLVALSIVGLERVPGFGYYQAKLAQESALLAGPLPVSIVRATQFHEFAVQILSRARLGPLAAVPIMRIQPVAARAVGEALVEVATGPGGAPTAEIAGPEEKDLVSLARAIVRKRQRRIVVAPLRVPGSAGKAMRTGGQLPSPAASVIGPRFEEWLAGEDLASMFA
jgi:uncharacterized protein YbjT (DUF2867 family)